MKHICTSLPKPSTSASCCHIHRFALLHNPVSIFSCSIRFPSTNIRLWFQSLLEEVDFAYEEIAGDEPEQPAAPPTQPLPGLRPLSITIPNNTSTEYEASPPTSPTGTISVPNSCPTSPNSHRVFNPYSQYRPGGSGQVDNCGFGFDPFFQPLSQVTPSYPARSPEVEETKPELALHLNSAHNAVVYPTEDGGLSTVPVGPSPPHTQVKNSLPKNMPDLLDLAGKQQQQQQQRWVSAPASSSSSK